MPVRRRPVPGYRQPDRLIDLSLPHVPEGIRGVLCALGLGAWRRVRVDAGGAEEVSVFEFRRARILRGLRDAADFRGAGWTGDRGGRVRRSVVVAAGYPVWHRGEDRLRRNVAHPS